MIAYFCSTPYQILVALQIQRTFCKNKIADLYILNHFNDSNEYVTRLDKTGIFNKVIYVECLNFSISFRTNKVKRLVKKIKSFYLYKYFSLKYLGISNIKYTDVYFSTPDVIIQIGLKKIYENNKNVKVHLFEDGAGIYLGFSQILTKSKKFFNKIMRQENIIDRYDDLYVFAPSIMRHKEVPLLKIPQFNKEDSDYVQILNYIFGFSSEELNYKIIFFEQPYDFISGFNNKMIDIAKEILKNDYIVKLHPRSDTKDYVFFNCYNNNSTPWEIICINSKIEDKILITFFSTSVLTNKIFINKEPIVVFLYELPELKKIYPLSQEIKNFVSRFKNIYNEPDRIIIPKSLDELHTFLNSHLMLS